MSAEQLIAGGLASLTEMVMLGHTLEQIQIKRQAHQLRYPVILRELRTSFGQHGIASLYRGFYPWGVFQSLKGAPVFFTQEYTYRRFIEYTDSKTAILLSGLSGGAGQGIFLTPLQRLKTEMITMNDPQVGPYACAKHIVGTQGVTGLFRGLFPQMCKRSIDWGIRFSVADKYKSFVGDYTPMGNLCGGLIGGFCSTCVSTPFAVLTAVYQREQKSTPDLKSLLAEFKDPRLLWRGFAVNAFHSAYFTGFTMMMTPVFKRQLQALL